MEESYREKKVGIEISEMDIAMRTIKMLNHIKGKKTISTTFSTNKKIACEQQFEKQQKP